MRVMKWSVASNGARMRTLEGSRDDASRSEPSVSAPEDEILATWKCKRSILCCASSGFFFRYLIGKQVYERAPGLATLQCAQGTDALHPSAIDSASAALHIFFSVDCPPSTAAEQW